MSADGEALTRLFQDTFKRAPTVVSEAPARVNLIGEHTDYNQGFVLPLAIDRTIAVAGAVNDSPNIRVHSIDFDDCYEFSINSVRSQGGAGWANYVRGVVWAMREAGHGLRGVDLAISGDVPHGAGLSSSAALEVAIGGALCAVSGIDVSPRDLALLCQRAENEFVGVQCGIMDQFAAALGRAGSALLIDCRSLEVNPVPLPNEVAIVVVDSKVPRRLANTAYNRRREECGEAARLLGISSLRDAHDGLLERGRSSLPNEIYRRARHVARENARVAAAVDALRSGDLNAFGDLLYQSHASLKDDFEVSCPELDMLVALSRDTEGIYGARLTGAGFGGCTVNLVRPEALAAFRDSVIAPYQNRTGLVAEMHVCCAVDGLRVSIA